MQDELDTVFNEIEQDVKAFVEEIIGHKSDKAELQAKLDAANAEIDALKAKITEFSGKTKTALTDAKTAAGVGVALLVATDPVVASDAVNPVLPAVDPFTGLPV